LAIRIAGARLAARPGWPVRVLAERLADATRRLDELAAGELAVRASFPVSLHTLQESSDPVDRAAAAVRPRPGCWTSPSPPPRSSWSGWSTRSCWRAVSRTATNSTTWSRLYARQHASSQQREPERLAALTRLVGFYTATAWQAQVLRPGDRRAAATHQQWGDGPRSLTNLGAVDERLGEHDEAVARLQEGLTMFRELGSPYGQAAALRYLGDTLRAVARHQQARAAWQEALAICQALQLPEADQIHAQLAALPSQDPEPANGP
jgi:tetratricopeptide (TPR) repeat protein